MTEVSVEPQPRRTLSRHIYEEDELDFVFQKRNQDQIQNENSFEGGIDNFRTPRSASDENSERDQRKIEARVSSYKNMDESDMVLRESPANIKITLQNYNNNNTNSKRSPQNQDQITPPSHPPPQPSNSSEKKYFLITY